MSIKAKQANANMLLILAAVAVLFILILFLMNNNSGNEKLKASSDAKLTDLQTLGVSDKASDLENDLEKTNIENIDEELSDLN